MQARTKKLKFTIVKYPMLDYGRIDLESSIKRPVTVVNGVPLYKSTGQSSQLADTWMPFLGLNGDALVHKRSVWIMKPHGGCLRPEQANEIYPGEIVDLVAQYVKSVELRPVKQDKRLRSVLGRFGCLSGMAASAALGGGFWSTQFGRDIKNILQRHFPELLVGRGVVLNRLASHMRDESVQEGREQKRRKHRDAVSAVNDFIRQQSQHASFFHEDSERRRVVYEEFGESHQLNKNNF